MGSKFLFAKTVVFVHIPKTAGMSFIRYLESGLKGSPGSPPSDISLDKELICSHEYLRSVHPRVKNGYFITFLRDPIARTLSQYKYMQSPGLCPPGWRESFPKEEADVIEFYRSATFSEVLNCTDDSVVGHIVNPQTRMLCDQELAGMEEELSKEAMLASACNNLISKIDFFGISEMFASSLAMLRRETGIDGKVVHINESPRHHIDLSVSDRARLHEILDLDIQLYEFGLKIFHRRMRSWLADNATGPAG